MDPRDITLAEIMRSEFVSVSAEERLDFADRLLRLGHFRHLPVLDGGKLVGIVSLRDLLAAALSGALSSPSDASGSRLQSVEVSQVMTREVVTGRPETALAEAARRMLEHGIGCLPVIDADERVIGLVTETDLLRAVYCEPPGPSSGR